MTTEQHAEWLRLQIQEAQRAVRESQRELRWLEEQLRIYQETTEEQQSN